MFSLAQAKRAVRSADVLLENYTKERRRAKAKGDWELLLIYDEHIQKNHRYVSELFEIASEEGYEQEFKKWFNDRFPRGRNKGL